MRFLVIVFTATVLCAACVQAQDAAPAVQEKLTLDRALEIAFQRNPDLRSAVAQLEKSKGGLREARANFNPKFTAEVTHLRQGPQVSFVVPGGPRVNIIQEHNTTAVVSFLLPIDVSKKLSYVSDIAKYQFQLDYLSLLAASQKLIYDVKNAYYDLLRAQAQKEVARKAVEAAKARLKDANARYSAGTAPKFDVMRAEVDVANFNQQLIRAQSRVAMARAAFNKVLGLDVNAPTEVAPIDVPADQSQPSPDFDQALEEAYSKRPEIKTGETAFELAKKNVKLQRTGILPTLAATANYNYNFRVSGFSTSNESWTALLNLSVPIWDGGVTKAKVDQANADVEKSAQTLQNIKLAVALDVKNATLALNDALKRMATAEQNVKLAEEALRLANVRYNAGVSTMVELSDAELALTQARTEYVNARYDYAAAVAALEKATGNQPELAKLRLLE
ncbi:MAG: TolC family protein [Armatimonadota bacterium]|nr:TolC family protein [Armatimonadota bacterium]